MSKRPKMFTARELQQQMEADPDNLAMFCWDWYYSVTERNRISNMASKLAEVSDTFKLCSNVDDFLLVGFEFIKTHLEECPRETQKEILNCLATELNFVSHIEDLEECND